MSLPAKPERFVPVVCDLCEAPFELPASMIHDGQVFGLLVCSQCAEDELMARSEATASAGLCGSAP